MYQFKQRNGKFVLIGYESYNIGVGMPDEAVAFKSGVSYNYLNNTSREYYIQRRACAGYKEDFLTCKTKKKSNYQPIKKIEATKLKSLDEFDVWELN